MFREYFHNRRILREARRIEKRKLRELEKENAAFVRDLKLTRAKLVIARNALDHEFERMDMVLARG